jgi:hypothetical protein
MKDQYGVPPEVVAGTDPWMDSPDKDRSAITDEVVESLGRGENDRGPKPPIISHGTPDHGESPLTHSSRIHY